MHRDKLFNLRYTLRTIRRPRALPPLSRWLSRNFSIITICRTARHDGSFPGSYFEPVCLKYDLLRSENYTLTDPRSPTRLSQHAPHGTKYPNFQPVPYELGTSLQNACLSNTTARLSGLMSHSTLYYFKRGSRGYTVRVGGEGIIARIF